MTDTASLRTMVPVLFADGVDTDLKAYRMKPAALTKLRYSGDGIAYSAATLVCVPRTFPELDAGRPFDGLLAVSAHRGVSAARAAAAKLDGAVVVTFRYITHHDEAFVAQRDDTSTTGEYCIVASSELREVMDTLYDVSCSRCGLFNDDGEGWDGLCGDCADVADAAGEFG